MDARRIHEALRKSVQIQDLYKGDCRGCGQCCSRFLPLTIQEEFVIGGYVKKHGIQPTPPRAEIDLMCPFLDEHNECAIYEVRPQICRHYRCDKHKNGTLPFPKGMEKMRVVDMREKFRR